MTEPVDDPMNRNGKAIFLDRDGTLIEHIPYLHDPHQVKLVESAREGLLKALGSGWCLFLFTNQSGVGRGMFTMQEVEACNVRMLELLDLPDPGFTETCIAPEAPGESGGYRKPNPRFINEMMDKHGLPKASCCMIGDSDCDRDAARNAGIAFERVGGGRSLLEVIQGLIDRDRS